MYGEAMRDPAAQMTNGASITKRHVEDGLFHPASKRQTGGEAKVMWATRCFRRLVSARGPHGGCIVRADGRKKSNWPPLMDC